MKKSITYILLASAIALVLGFQDVLFVQAAENQNGGQVATDGLVTFYEESSESKVTEPKPKESNFPSTGEKTDYSLMTLGIGMLLLLFSFLLKFMWKQNGEANQ